VGLRGPDVVGRSWRKTMGGLGTKLLATTKKKGGEGKKMGKSALK